MEERYIRYIVAPYNVEGFERVSLSKAATIIKKGSIVSIDTETT